jgi:hypothetical protein
MKSRPLPILILAILFIIVGLVGFSSHIKDFFEPGIKIYVVLLVQLLRVSAIVSGILLLRASNFGRWLTIAWVVSHVVIGALNSTFQLIAHIVLLIIVSILLFLPASSRYFHGKKQTLK